MKRIGVGFLIGIGVLLAAAAFLMPSGASSGSAGIARAWVDKLLGRGGPRGVGRDDLTCWSMRRMHGVLVYYYKTSDAAEWENIGRVQSLKELWESVATKRVGGKDGEPVVALPVEKDLLIDGWEQPFELQITVLGDATVITITSKGRDRRRFFEIEFPHDKKHKAIKLTTNTPL